MSEFARRLNRIEELLGATECICVGESAVEILIVEDGWDEAHIKQAEEAKQIACPVHGVSRTPILRLAGSDVHG